jgi:predicted RNA-binding Zn-ribbon protein involved in translation (DUF1610 family)
MAMPYLPGTPSQMGPPGGGAGRRSPFQQVGVCSSCNKEVPDSVTAGDKCPHCGVFFSKDETNGKTASGGGTTWTLTPRGWGKLLGLAIAGLCAAGAAIKKSMS